MAGSWQSYVDTLVNESNSPIIEAAICGRECGKEGLWASSPGLCSITADEIKKLAGDLRQNGPHVAGMKCMLLTDHREDPNVFSMNLKSGRCSDGNTYPVCVGQTHQAFIIAKGKADAGNQLTGRVYKMVKYLRDSNL